MSVLLVAGSPTERSRSAVLLDAVAQRLQFRGVQGDKLLIRDLSPQAMILGDFGHPTISQAIGRVAKADVVVLATPIHNAAYSGVLKVFLDLLPQTALAGKTVLPLATGGGAGQSLAIDYALRPVLQALGAKQILGSIFATDAQISISESGAYHLSEELGRQLDEAVNTLITDVLPASRAHTRRFAPVPFSQVSCSV
jgi:FMN reductase